MLWTYGDSKRPNMLVPLRENNWKKRFFFPKWWNLFLCCHVVPCFENALACQTILGLVSEAFRLGHVCMWLSRSCPWPNSLPPFRCLPYLFLESWDFARLRGVCLDATIFWCFGIAAKWSRYAFHIWKPIVMISDVFNMNAFNEHDNIILVSCNIYIYIYNIIYIYIPVHLNFRLQMLLEHHIQYHFCDLPPGHLALVSPPHNAGISKRMLTCALGT